MEDFDLLSYYYMTLHRPKLEKGIFDIDSEYSLLTREAHLKKAKRNDISDTKKNKVSKNFYSKIICTLPESLTLLLEKCERNLGIDIWEKKKSTIENKVIVLFSADGAAHQVSQEGDSNVITVNLNIVNSLLLSHGVTSTQSHHILTVMQVVGAEKSDLCCSIFYPFLEEIKLFDVTQLPIKYHHLAFYFYNINDTKMLYSLSQHSLFTRKGFPYLQCICCREGSMDQKCQMITNNSYGKAYRRSEKHFNTTLKKKNKKFRD